MIVHQYILYAAVNSNPVIWFLAIANLSGLLTFLKVSRKVKQPFVSQHQMVQIELEIREQLLRKISQELHDNIGQILTVVKLQLTSLHIKNNIHVNRQIFKSIQLVSDALDGLRNISKSMDAANLAAVGLIKQVANDLECISETGLIAASLTHNDIEIDFTLPIQTIIYRIVQESLSNIIKHAGASIISVECTLLPDRFSIIISDNGKGFNPDKIDNSNQPGHTGAGLRNINSRAKLIGGELTIISAIGTGTTVSLSVPVNGFR